MAPDLLRQRVSRLTFGFNSVALVAFPTGFFPATPSDPTVHPRHQPMRAIVAAWVAWQVPAASLARAEAFLVSRQHTRGGFLQSDPDMPHPSRGRADMVDDVPRATLEGICPPRLRVRTGYTPSEGVTVCGTLNRPRQTPGGERRSASRVGHDVAAKIVQPNGDDQAGSQTSQGPFAFCHLAVFY